MKALVPQPGGEIQVREVQGERGEEALESRGRRSTSGAARQLRLWIAVLCLAWCFLGFLAGTWFGGRRAATSPDRNWYVSFADRFAREFDLTPQERTLLAGRLEEYDTLDRQMRAAYSLEMESEREDLAALGNVMYSILLEEIVVDPQRRKRLRERLLAQEGR